MSDKRCPAVNGISGCRCEMQTGHNSPHLWEPRDVGVMRSELRAAVAERTATRDHWIRLWNRLEAAVTHHKRATAGLASDADEALYAARDRILSDAAKPSTTPTTEGREIASTETERRHSSACIDATECDGVEHCICLPDEEARAPEAHELWWCSYCGEPSCEDSDPCQRCGEKIERVPLVRRASVVREVVEWLRADANTTLGTSQEHADRIARKFGASA